jgi:chromate reductase
MNNVINILGFAGSLRKGSLNRHLLKASFDLVPSNAKLEIFDLDGIPPLNQDFERSPPSKVIEFKAKIKASDAILIVTPEYNYSIPGVLKNAIDWASRPFGDNSFQGKPAAIMSASTGMLGGARVQYHLRQVFVFLDVHAINRPEVMVSQAEQKFDANGQFTDEKGKELIRTLLNNLVNWCIKIQANPVAK